jgi:hypothetical protein
MGGDPFSRAADLKGLVPQGLHPLRGCYGAPRNGIGGVAQQVRRTEPPQSPVFCGTPQKMRPNLSSKHYSLFTGNYQ